MEVLKEYSENGMHKIAGQDFYCEEHAKKSKVSSIVPENFKTFFIDSGAEVVENAIKIAYKKMGPLPGVSCSNAFHGELLVHSVLSLVSPYKKPTFWSCQLRR
jgi:4-aminobutyrate aminotransferase